MIIFKIKYEICTESWNLYIYIYIYIYIYDVMIIKYLDKNNINCGHIFKMIYEFLFDL